MSLRYPADGFSGNTDYVTFSPVDYLQARGGGGGAGGANGITIYMPESTPTVANGNSWGQAQIQEGPFGRALFDTAADAADVIYGISPSEAVNGMSPESKKLLEDNLDSAFGRFTDPNNLTSYGRQLTTTAIAGMMGTNANSVLSVTRGQIYNHNVELAYQSPQLRQFTFNFNMVTKSAADAAAIDAIILRFKQESAPEDSGNGMYKIPKVWNINYMGAAAGHMNRFKPAACLSIAVQDNAGIPFYASHRDGAPVSTSLQLTFQEIEVITRRDHTGARGM